MIAKMKQKIYLIEILNKYENTKFMPMAGKRHF